MLGDVDAIIEACSERYDISSKQLSIVPSHLNMRNSLMPMNSNNLLVF